PHALGLARRTVNTMRANIAIALLTVAALLVGVLLGGVTMSIGMLVHEASVLLVIGIAMLLLRPPLPEDAAAAPGGEAVAAGRRRRRSGLADELRLEPHGPDAVDPALAVMVAVGEADVLHLGPHLHHEGRALHLQVLDDRDGVAVLQLGAMGVAHDT